MIQRLKSPGLSVVSGILLSLAFPSWLIPSLHPWTGWLAWIGLVPLLVAIENAGPRRAFLLGWLSGISFWASTLYWIGGIREMEYMALPAVSCFALYLGLFTGGWAALLRWKRMGPYWLAAPALWVILEWLRGWLFSGFSWTPLGASQWAFPAMFLSARFLGVSVVSAAVVSVNMAVWSLVRRGGERKIGVYASAVLLLVLLVLSTVAANQVRRDVSGAKPVRVALLQGNFTEAEKWALPLEVLLSRFEALSLAAGKEKPDIILWPESATASELSRDALTQARISRLAARTKSVQMAGAIYLDKDGKFYNAAVALSPKGPFAVYRKQHLVPFGEFIPAWIRTILPFARKLTEGVGDYSPGSDPAPMDLGAAGKAGVGICYEAIFPGIYRNQARQGAEYLLNQTNDAWYLLSAATYQHALGSITRAVECGRYLARCANTGLTLVVTPEGRMVSRLGLFETGVQIGDLKHISGVTAYARWGDLPLLLAAIFLLAVSILAGKRTETGQAGR